MDYRLPAVYGKSRLVLLPVDPYLIHAYWEIAPGDFDKGKEQAGEADEVLRFYKTRGIAGEDELADYFDVEIDLQAGNWYVHLWSAEESYFADLALKREDGTLIRLVRSQVIQMPRTHPAIAIDQRFMKVESVERRAEIVPLPPAEYKPPQEAVALRAAEHVGGTPVAKPADSEESPKEEIEPVYAIQQLPGDRSEPDDAPAASMSNAPAGSPALDLAALAEKRFATGLSSAALQQGRPDRSPDSQK